MGIVLRIMLVGVVVAVHAWSVGFMNQLIDLAIYLFIYLFTYLLGYLFLLPL